MRDVPKWTEFPKYPAVACFAVAATALTAAWWAGIDISLALENAEIRRGQVWRLFSSIFPHLNVLHLVFNIYWFWVFGTAVERKFGPLRTTGLFVLFAISSNTLDFAFADGGVGLSGVVYGLFGMLWVLSRQDDRFRDAVDQKTMLLFVAWFFFCILTTVTDTIRVANVAHGSGAVLGMLVGTAVILPRYRWGAAVGICALFLLGAWGATLGRPMVNFSGRAGFEEGQWGYQALLADRNEEAVRWFKDAAKQQPRTPQYWYNLGIAYHRLGNVPAAKDAYNRAHQLEPSNPEYAVPSLD